jgi:hypothetical protein
MLLPLAILAGIDDMILVLLVVFVASIVGVVVLSRRGRKAPTRRAPSATPVPAPTPARVGRAAEVPSEKVDEDAVRLKVEKTATESAVRSLESALKEGAITKETFTKYKATYDERLRKIDGELSKKTRGQVGITKLEGEVDKVRQSYLDKLKTLSTKAIALRPVAASAGRPAAGPSREAPTPVARAPKLPEVPSGREEVTEKPFPPLARPSRAEPIEVAPQRPVAVAPGAASSGPTTISDLRREMMDELNRLKRLIGHAGS